MNEGGVFEKVEKAAVVSRRLIQFTVVFAVFIAILGGIYYLYQISGYKEYKAALSHLNSLTGSDKTKMGDKFFGPWDTPNSYSGILAVSWKDGILVWAKSGLKYQPLENNTRFLTIPCSKNNISGLLLLRSNRNPNNLVQVFSTLGQWRNKVHPGNYIALDISENGKVDSITAYPEFKASMEPWVFCNVTVPQQKAI